MTERVNVSSARRRRRSLVAGALASVTMLFLAPSASVGQSATKLLSSHSETAPSAARPRMYFIDDSRLGRPFAKDPSVVRFRDAYYMYYSLPPGKTPYTKNPKQMVWGIGIARSLDLYDWKKVGEILPEQTTEMKGIAAPGARVINGKLELFYQTYDPANYRSSSICHASSADGIHFQKDPSNPVYHPEHMPWSAGRAIDAEVIVFGHSLRMYFATRDPEMKVQMVALAEADLASGFSRGSWHDVDFDAPILRPELPWEGLCIEAPSVVSRDGKMFLFYAGNYNNHPQQIGVAKSSDGLHWTRLSDKPLIANGLPGTWNSSESGHPGALQVGNRSFIFYQGNNDDGNTYYLSVVPLSWDGDMPHVSSAPNVR